MPSAPTPTAEAPAAPPPEISPEITAEPEPPPPPAGGPRCDQRELVVDGGASRKLCVDYSDHRGTTAPRCFEGVELEEGPCPEAGVVARCELAATGVTMLHYEGVELDAVRRDCEAIRGDFQLG